MIARASGRCRHDCEAKCSQIERLDKCLDHARRIIGINIILHRSLQKRCLRAIMALNKAYGDLPMEVGTLS